MWNHYFTNRSAWQNSTCHLLWVACAVLTGWSSSVQAQWITQTNHLQAGWNSVYLHVDASHTSVNSLMLDEPNIEEVWLWTFDLPPSLVMAAPPTRTPSSRWSQWTRLDGVNSVLQTLPANAALLVKAAVAAPWEVKGRPVPPNLRWSLTGLNFVGFPTALPTPSFEEFLAPDAQALDWRLNAEIFRYQGGPLGASNPLQVQPILQRNVPVVREQAYWIRASESTNQINNSYFGPFQIRGVGSSGFRFGDRQGQARFYLKNMTDAPLTVTLQEVASEPSPNDITPPLLPLMVRGAINITNITFSYSSLKSSDSRWTLAAKGSPGSEVEIVLGVDRSKMLPGSTNFASVLRFTDSLGLSRVEIGASATMPSRAGLWVGNAVVDQVSQYLKSYAKATNATLFHALLNEKGLTAGVNNPSGTNVLRWATSPDRRMRYQWDTNTSLVLMSGTNANGLIFTGSYLPKGSILTNLARVARPVSLRLIVHNDGTTSRLMQRAYLGRNGSNYVVAARQTGVAGDLANARRLSAVHLPTTDANEAWVFDGVMRDGDKLQTTVDLSFRDQASNPFLHTYHPDHDNQDPLFAGELLSGQESYDIRRVISLTFAAPGDDFDSLTRDGVTLGGDYAETISFRNFMEGTVLKQFNALGTFSLMRITDTAELVP